jgi:hypothetical protein
MGKSLSKLRSKNKKVNNLADFKDEDEDKLDKEPMFITKNMRKKCSSMLKLEDLKQPYLISIFLKDHNTFM